MDNDFGPRLLLSHPRDVLVEFLNLRLNGCSVWRELFLRELVQGREGKVSSLVPLDS